MNDSFSPHHIRVFGKDGSTRSFTQSETNLANHALTALNPPKLFSEDKVKILDDDGEFILDASQLERIDLVTDRLSVWDFPFMIGAHVELTEGEFRECLESPQRWESPQWRGDLPVFTMTAMTSGLRYYFWMEVAGGLPAIRMSRICAMIQEGRLFFGLRTGGIGILNLEHMMRLSMHPEPPQATAEAQSAGYRIEQNEFGLSEFLVSPAKSGKPQRKGRRVSPTGALI